MSILEELRNEFTIYKPPVIQDPFYTKLSQLLNVVNNKDGELDWNEDDGRNEIITVLSDYVVSKDDLDNHLNIIVELVNLIPDDEYKLIVKRSNIPDAGYGLFYVGETIINDDVDLTIYGGKTTKPDSDDYNQDSFYLLELDETNVQSFKGWKIDGEYGFKLGDKGRWANTKIIEKENNAEFRVSETPNIEEFEPRPTVYISVKDDTQIQPGDEIYVDYGEEYRNRLYTLSSKKHRIKYCITCKIKKGKYFERTNVNNVYCSAQCQYKYYFL